MNQQEEDEGEESKPEEVLRRITPQESIKETNEAVFKEE